MKTVNHLERPAHCTCQLHFSLSHLTPQLHRYSAFVLFTARPKAVSGVLHDIITLMFRCHHITILNRSCCAYQPHAVVYYGEDFKSPWVEANDLLRADETNLIHNICEPIRLTFASFWRRGIHCPSIQMDRSNHRRLLYMYGRMEQGLRSDTK